jgi:hypothetical protein
MENQMDSDVQAAHTAMSKRAAMTPAEKALAAFPRSEDAELRARYEKTLRARQ